MKKPIKIHFVCTGNAYRSRLAETYLKSLNIPNVTVSSSGLETDKYRSGNGPICWYALRIITKHNLMAYVSSMSVQTEKIHLIESDVIILMHPDNHIMYKKYFPDISKKASVWNIPDLHHLGFTKAPETIDEEIIILKATEETFEKIKKNVDELVEKLE